MKLRESGPVVVNMVLCFNESTYVLLKILRSSIEKTSRMAAIEEQRFQDAIINTIAEFAKNLPDAQKIEILKFILNFDSLLW